MEIKLLRGHEKGGVNYQQEPVKWLIRWCDKTAKEIREKARSINTEMNIKFYGCYSLMKDGRVQMRSIKEMFRVTDSRIEEIK